MSVIIANMTMAKGIESKGALKERLKREGRWREFVELRESLKANGVTPKDAWKQAREQFPPLETANMLS